MTQKKKRKTIATVICLASVLFLTLALCLFFTSSRAWNAMFRLAEKSQYLRERLSNVDRNRFLSDIGIYDFTINRFFFTYNPFALLGDGCAIIAATGALNEEDVVATLQREGWHRAPPPHALINVILGGESVGNGEIDASKIAVPTQWNKGIFYFRNRGSKSEAPHNVRAFLDDVRHSDNFTFCYIDTNENALWYYMIDS